MTPEDLDSLMENYREYGHYGFGKEVPGLVDELRKAWAANEAGVDADRQRIIELEAGNEYLRTRLDSCAARIEELRDKLGAARTDAAQYRHRWKAASEALACVNEVIGVQHVGPDAAHTLAAMVREAAKTQPRACSGNPVPHHPNAFTCTGVLR